jgi:hypothetical protein
MAASIARLISIEVLTSVPWRESLSRVKTSESVGASGAEGGSKLQGEGSPHPWRGAEGGTERAKRSGGLHKRSAEDWKPLAARDRGSAPERGLSTVLGAERA